MVVLRALVLPSSHHTVQFVQVRQSCEVVWLKPQCFSVAQRRLSILPVEVQDGPQIGVSSRILKRKEIAFNLPNEILLMRSH